MAELDRARWDDRGPRSPPRYVRLIRPAAGETLTVVLVSPAVVGLWLHWVEGRTVPCMGEEEGCPWHDGGTDRDARWKGFASAVRGPSCRLEVVEITGEAWARAPDVRQASDAAELRGQELSLARAAGGPRKPVSAWLPCPGRRVHYADRLPPAPDVRAAVAVLFPARPWDRGRAERRVCNEQARQEAPIRAAAAGRPGPDEAIDTIPLP